MTTFEVLLIAHLIGDWLLQTEWQATHKQDQWRAMLTHVVMYHVVVLAVLLPRFGVGSVRMWATIVGLAILHAILDRRSTVVALMRVLRITVDREPEQWLVLVIDQSLHLLLLAWATVILTT